MENGWIVKVRRPFAEEGEDVARDYRAFDGRSNLTHSLHLEDFICE